MTKSDTWRRLAVETPEGPTLLFDPADVFYMEAAEHDTLVRTARAKPYRSTRRLAELLARLPKPPFFRCHEKYVVIWRGCARSRGPVGTRASGSIRPSTGSYRRPEDA